ncbi:MAG: IMP dehydrogenase [Candidatus Desulforudis sp.]|nr:IMP dehydrogenase [Desulforudis sp.]
MRNYLPPEYIVHIDQDRCRRCGECVRTCAFGTLRFEHGAWRQAMSVFQHGRDDLERVFDRIRDNVPDRVAADNKKCVQCHYCVAHCPEGAISIQPNPLAYRGNHHWEPHHLKNIWLQAETGGMVLTGSGNDKAYFSYFDHMVLDACQVTNPSIDPLREPMELRTYLGSLPDALEFESGPEGPVLKTRLAPSVRLDTPLVFPAMSYGAISLNAQKALAKAAVSCGILMNTGEGGMHEDLYPYAHRMVVQVASGRFGVNPGYLRRGAVVEIKIGQGAKPGIGGHLPGEKVDEGVSQTRMIPVGSDALSPAPHHDIYSIEDLSQLIFALKEATEYTKPVSVKIAAVHNVAAIASGIARAGADIITIDGFRGGTGATPLAIRDHVGIPIEMALAAVDDRLRREGIRNRVSLVASGGIRHSGDVAKAIALGADAVAIGTAALIAMGCRLCQKCYTGNCNWGIATQKPELTARLDPDRAAENLANLIRGWSLELKEILGALGLNSVESLRGSRLRLRGVGLSDADLQVLGIRNAGVGA